MVEQRRPGSTRSHEVGVAFPVERPLGDHAPSLRQATGGLKPLVASRPGQLSCPGHPRFHLSHPSAATEVSRGIQESERPPPGRPRASVRMRHVPVLAFPWMARSGNIRRRGAHGPGPEAVGAGGRVAAGDAGAHPMAGRIDQGWSIRGRIPDLDASGTSGIVGPGGDHFPPLGHAGLRRHAAQLVVGRLAALLGLVRDDGRWLEAGHPAHPAGASRPGQAPGRPLPRPGAQRDLLDDHRRPHARPARGAWVRRLHRRPPGVGREHRARGPSAGSTRACGRRPCWRWGKTPGTSTT